MTPEQTLDWLAQQHFDQCCEERPIQDWIRKMKSQLPEQPKQNTVEAVKAVLKGIDQTEIESPDGWWETSAGAEFGAKKLKYVIGLLAQPEQEPVGEVVTAGVIRWKDKYPSLGTKLYTIPPQRTWVGLTPEEVEDAIVEGNLLDDYPQEFVAIIEAKLKEKNT